MPLTSPLSSPQRRLAAAFEVPAWPRFQEVFPKEFEFCDEVALAGAHEFEEEGDRATQESHAVDHAGVVGEGARRRSVLQADEFDEGGDEEPDEDGVQFLQQPLG